jgi:hypothetical protein
VARRSKTRKVVIRFRSWNPDDPLSILAAVESALKPESVEVSVEKAGHASDSPSQVNEVLEAEATEAIQQKLVKANRDATPSKVAPLSELAKKRDRLKKWLVRTAKSGFAITVKLLPVVKSIKQLLK